MGIPKKERGTVYDVHHIVTRSDVKENPELWADFNVNEASNLFPIPRKDHERLHRKIDQMGKRH